MLNAMVIDCTKMTVLNDISERLSRVTLADLDGANRRTKARGERASLGSITEFSTKALWVVAEQLIFASKQEMIVGQAANSAAQEEVHRAASWNFLHSHEAAKHLFWAQAKQELRILGNCCVCLAADWEVVDEHTGKGGISNAEFLNMLMPPISAAADLPMLTSLTKMIAKLGTPGF